LLIEEPVLIREALVVNENCIFGVAGDFLVQMSINNEKMAKNKDIVINPERLHRSFLTGIDLHMENMSKSHMNLTKPDPFLNIARKSQSFDFDKKSKENESDFDHLASRIRKKNNLGIKYNFSKTHQIIEESEDEEQFEFSTGQNKLNSYSFQLKILRKLNLEDKNNKIEFKKLDNLQKYTKLVKYFEIGVLVRFDANTFEFFLDSGLNEEFGDFRQKVPGEILDVVVNERLGYLVFLTFNNENKGNYHVLIYNLISLMNVFEKKYNKEVYIFLPYYLFLVIFPL